jgi:hypothetical protein
MEDISKALDRYNTKQDQSYTEDILSVVKDLKEFDEFYTTCMAFLTDGDMALLDKKDFQEIFVMIHKELQTNPQDIWRICSYLTHKIHKINKSDLSYDEKIDTFITSILGENNISLVQEYVQKNYTNSWDKQYKFLKNAWDLLVKPIIVGGMWTMGIVNYLGSDYIDTLPSWSTNFIQAFVTLSVLIVVREYAKYKSKK